jgi:hypothetical protein
MAFNAKKATRELIWVKLALMAPSGGGKTYSSLRLATGMLESLKEKGLGQNGRILMVNSEQKRGYYYANEFEYDIIDLEAPHTPENYIEAIEWAVKEDYPILILDSTSHEWEGSGGCLELHQKAGGTFQAWSKITPRHNKFLAAIADSHIQIIATMRGKDQYSIEQGDKMSVKKLGVGAKQREGFEYEFTASFLMDQSTNTADVQKDNTHLFENLSSILFNEGHGKDVIEWANSGSGYTPPIRGRESIDDVKSTIIDLCKTLGGKDNADLMDALKEYDPSANPNRIKDLDKAIELRKKLQEMNADNNVEESE